MRFLSLISLIALSILIAACGPATTSTFHQNQQSFVAYTVEFNPNATVPRHPDQLKIVTPGQKCPDTSAAPGCVRFEENTFGVVTFRLQGQGGANDTCGADPNTKWVITQIRGTESGSSGKGTGWGSPFSAWVTKAFFPIENEDNGILYREAWTSGRPEVTLLNLNNNPYQNGVKTLYYEVTATNCQTQDTKTSDPGVENEGLH